MIKNLLYGVFSEMLFPKQKQINYIGGLFLDYGVEDLIWAFAKLKGDDLHFICMVMVNFMMIEISIRI